MFFKYYKIGPCHNSNIMNANLNL